MTHQNSRNSNSSLLSIYQSRRHPTRRRFLQVSAAALSTVALSNCARNTLNQQSTASSPVAQTDSKTLYIYTWADYSSNELYQRFRDKTGIQVIADVYDSNEMMLNKLQAGGGDQYSLIFPSDYTVRQMIDSQLLLPLDQSKLKGFDNIMDRWKSPTYDPNSAHSIAFNWGTTGLLYNTKVVSTEPTDWDFLWQNRDALSGKITLLDDVRETMGAVLKSLGYSYNATEPAQIEAAYQKLLELKPHLASFKTIGWEDQLISGDLAVCMAYSNLGSLLPIENPQLKYVIPQSGTSIWTDTMAIPAKAPNVEAAYTWINFVLEPENGAYAATQLKLGTPNKTAFELLPAEVKSNPFLYPSAEVVKAGEGIQPVGDAINLYEKYWTEVKSA